MVNGETYYYYDLAHFEQVSKLPFSIRILLESALRNCDGFLSTEADVMTILNWVKYKGEGVEDDKEYEVPFKPSRVILQDFTGVPAGSFSSTSRLSVSSQGHSDFSCRFCCYA